MDEYTIFVRVYTDQESINRNGGTFLMSRISTTLAAAIAIVSFIGIAMVLGTASNRHRETDTIAGFGLLPHMPHTASEDESILTGNGDATDESEVFAESTVAEEEAIKQLLEMERVNLLTGEPVNYVSISDAELAPLHCRFGAIFAC